MTKSTPNPGRARTMKARRRRHNDKNLGCLQTDQRNRSRAEIRPVVLEAPRRKTRFIDEERQSKGFSFSRRSRGRVRRFFQWFAAFFM